MPAAAISFSANDARAPLLSFALAAGFLLALYFLFAEEAAHIPEEKIKPPPAQTAERKKPVPPVAIYEPLPETAAPAPAAVPPAEVKPEWLQYKIRRGDQLHKILPRIGAPEEAREFLLAQNFKSYRKLGRGRILEYMQNSEGELIRLRYKTNPEYYLTAELGENGKWIANEAPPLLSTVAATQGGRIETSLFAAADAAGVPERAIDALINALEWHIDFYRDPRPGDEFKLIYEKVIDEDGELLAVPRIRAYEYAGKARGKPRLVRGLWNPEESGYYSPEGESMQGAFLRAPLKYRRISSRFGMRKHPVRKVWRAHKGVDYAARRGTPVRATADGTVTRARRERGYGKVVMIKHYKIYTTVYGHLNGFARGIRKNKTVKQGDIIGYVGSTGLATGPHLHYEFRVRGKHKDPLSEALPRRLPPLSKKALAKFQKQTRPLLEQLAAAEV